MKIRTIPAAWVIRHISHKLSYSRAHIAKVMRSNVGALRAKRNEYDGQWHLPIATGERKLTALVRKQSGHRYKLGEKGPHKQINND